MDYYTTLGVDRSASQEEIKKAYRKLSMEHHPDRNQGNKESEEKFKEINEAYTILSNQDKRQEYDNPNPFSGSPFAHFNGFGFQQHRPRKPDLNQPRDGGLINLEAKLPLGTLIFGGKFGLKISYQDGCKDCGGKGFRVGKDCEVCHGVGVVEHVERRPGFMATSVRPCSSCGGKGQISSEGCVVCNNSGVIYIQDKEIVFDVSPKTELGSRLFSSGTGRSGLNGGRDGDIALFITGIVFPELSSEAEESLKKILGGA